MNRLKWCRRTAAGILLVTVILMVSCAFAQPGEVRPGMSEEEVTQLLGKPTRKAVLVGKALRDAEQFSTDDIARLRLVYIYDAWELQVWFWDGKVTGVTRHGVLLQ